MSRLIRSNAFILSEDSNHRKRPEHKDFYEMVKHRKMFDAKSSGINSNDTEKRKSRKRKHEQNDRNDVEQVDLLDQLIEAESLKRFKMVDMMRELNQMNPYPEPDETDEEEDTVEDETLNNIDLNIQAEQNEEEDIEYPFDFIEAEPIEPDIEAQIDDFIENFIKYNSDEEREYGLWGICGNLENLQLNGIETK